jgi:hypothetical protein
MCVLSHAVAITAAMVNSALRIILIRILGSVGVISRGLIFVLKPILSVVGGTQKWILI